MLIVVVVICSCLLAPYEGLLDIIKRTRLHMQQQEFKQHLIICRHCQGTGQACVDVNQLMVDAQLQLFVNKHLYNDRCTNCVRLPQGGYKMCAVVDNKRQQLSREYATIGAKYEMSACNQCMGMGKFTAFKPDGSYYTQEEYDHE